jgi:hypothetical protein
MSGSQVLLTLYRNSKALDRIWVEMIQTDSPFRSVTANISGKLLSAAVHFDVKGERRGLTRYPAPDPNGSIDRCMRKRL